MAPQMNLSNNEIGQIEPISSFDASEDEGKREAFNWINTQLLLNEVKLHKENKFDFPANRKQFMRSYQFFILNEEGVKQDFY